MNFYKKGLLVFIGALCSKQMVTKKGKNRALKSLPIQISLKINKEIKDEISTLTKMHAEVFARFKNGWPLQHTASMQIMEFYQLNLQKLNRMIMSTQNQNILKNKAFQNILKEIYIDNICTEVSQLFFKETGIYPIIASPQMSPYSLKQAGGHLMLSQSAYKSYDPLSGEHSQQSLDKIMDQIKRDSKIMSDAIDVVLSKYIARKIDDACAQINQVAAKIKSGEIIQEEDEKPDDEAEKF